MEAAVRPKYCPECGTKTSAEDRFCGGCGTAIGGANYPPSEPEAPKITVRRREVPGKEPKATMVADGFDSTAFVAALALGSAWVLLHLRRGSLRRGWLALVGAVPAAVMVWGWLSTVVRTFTEPYFMMFDRSTLQGFVVAALLLRLVATIPMALDAGRRPPPWPEGMILMRNLGLASLGAVLLGLAIDCGSYDGRRRAAVDSLKGSIKVSVNYLGRDRAEASRGLWKVAVGGPRVGASLPMGFRVTDGGHDWYGFDAAQAPPLAGEEPNQPWYWGDNRLSFSAVGPHPRFELTVGGKVMESGDLQARAGVP